MKRTFLFILCAMAIIALPMLTPHPALACDQIAMTVISDANTVDAMSPVMRTCVLTPHQGTIVNEANLYIDVIIGNGDVGVCGEQFVATTPSANFNYVDTVKHSDVDVGMTDIDAACTGSPRYPLKALIVDNSTDNANLDPVSGTVPALMSNTDDSRATAQIGVKEHGVLSVVPEHVGSVRYPLKGPIDQLDLKTITSLNFDDAGDGN
jgi:hypothetical protein